MNDRVFDRPAVSISPSASRVDVAIIMRWITVSAMALAACGDAEPTPSSAGSVRDSAGITIVENTIDTASARTGWAVDPTPTLTVGGLDAAEGEQFFSIAGARRLEDGRLAVVDGGSAELRVYAATGELVQTFGAKGEGPGEFMQPRLVGVFGADSLIVYDSQLRRVSILNPDDGFVRSYTVGTEGGGYPLAIGVTADGGLAMGGGMFFSSESDFQAGAQRANSRYVILSPDGSVRGDLGEVPAAELFGRLLDGGFSISRLPFGRVTVAASAPDRLWLGNGDSWEVRAYTLDATLKSIVRFDRRRPPVTESLRDAYLAERLEDAEDEADAQSIRSQFREMPSPDRLPPYQTFIVDALDNLWIGEYVLPGETTRTYTIVGPDGRLTGRLTLPEGTLPLDIGADYLMAVTLDELDVQRLTMWRLTRP
ncbi:MAG: hypothetical protein ACC682_09135 [Gemmatimonadota bacterium]